MTSLYSNNSLPTHIGIIMDGNRRWAKKRFLPTSYGHSKGAEAFKAISLYCNKIGIKYLTVYAFSTENWKRSQDEISYLMTLFKKYLNNAIEKFSLENIKIKFIGDLSKFPKEIYELILKVENKSSKNTGLVLNIAVNYGSRAEITHAAKALLEDVKSGKISLDEISEDLISNRLYNGNQPDVDLIVRTAGEKRMSNFMLWQSAYAELYFTSTLWPDFDEEEFNKALAEYSTRIRRFGGA